MRIEKSDGLPHEIRVNQGEFVVGQEVLRVFWSFFAGREEDVEHESEGVLDEFGDDPAEQTAAYLEGGVCVDLAQPGLAPFVDEEVQPKDLKAHALAGANEVPISDCVADVPGDLLHLREDFLIEVEGCVVEAIPVEFVVGELIGGLELVVVGEVLLDCIVGQVDALAHLPNRKLLRCCPHVPLLVPVKLQAPPHLHAQHIAPDVELPLFVQQRRNVLLKQIAALFCARRIAQDAVEGVLRVAEDADAVASVRELARLQNPNFLFESEVSDNILPVKAGDVVRFGEMNIGININESIIVDHVLVKQFFVGDFPVVGQVVVEEQLIREE